MAILTKQLGAMTANAIYTCDLRNGAHTSTEYQVENPFTFIQLEQVQYVKNYNRQQNNPYSITFSPGWCNHPNLSWRNNQNIA